MIQKMKSILNPSILFQTADNLIIINEESAESNIKKLFIYHPPKDCLAFTLDSKEIKSEQLSEYLCKCEKKINCSCDFVIMFCKNDQLNIIIGDLKSKHIKSEHVCDQIYYSKIFIEFILKVVERRYNLKTIIPNYKFVVIKSRRRNLNKMTFGHLNCEHPNYDESINIYDVSTSRDGHTAISFNQIF